MRPPSGRLREMTLKRSDRGAPAPFFALDFMREANHMEAAGRDVLHLEVGQPATSAPAGVLSAARDCLASQRLGYTEGAGIDPLRARIARYYRDMHGIDIPAHRVIVTTGSSGGFVLAFLSAFDAGDRVALALPSYPAYRNILTMLGLEVVELSATEADLYQPTPALLDRVEGTVDGLIVASPANPTGTLLSAENMKSLAGYCADRGIRLISDEIYHRITYGTTGVSALEFSDNALAINSFSKYYSMTGWRIGWMVVPEDLCRSVECLVQNLFICAPALSQLAAVEAFECTEELEANVARYAANRALLLEELPKAGLGRFVAPDGAFYIYADIGDLTGDSEAFCRTLLEETGVAVTPGIDFDRRRGGGTIRISFAGDTAAIAEAVARLRRWIGG